MSLIANENPSSILSYNVKFKTTNPDNNEIFVESFSVSGPTPSGTFRMPLNFISLSPNKIVVPLQTNTGPGSYWLKFWFPQPESNVMYITFCQKNDSMADGFYDYKTGVTNEFRSALKLWIKDNATTIPTGGNIYKKVLFTAYGLDTNQVSSAIEFKVSFRSNFTVASNPGNTSSTPGTIAPSTFQEEEFPVLIPPIRGGIRPMI